MRTSAILLLLLLFGVSLQAQEGPPRITITPESLQSMQERLAAYPNSADYQPRVHAVLALQAAEQAIRLDENRNAKRLLLRVFKDIDPATQDGRAARATIQNALAEIGKRNGALADQLRHARWAWASLEPGDPAEPWARAQMSAAYVEALYQDPLGNFLNKARYHLKKVRENPTASDFVKDFAAIQSAFISRDGQRDAMKAIAHIDEILNKEGQDRRLIVTGLIAQARLHKAAGRHDEAAKLQMLLAQQLQDEDAIIEVFPIVHQQAIADGAHDLMLHKLAVGRQEMLSGSMVGFLSQPSAAFPSRLVGNFVDVSYCVTPIGTVEDLTLVASRGSARWVQNVLRDIEAARYAGSSKPCSFNYKRLEVVSTRTVTKGSRLKQEHPSRYFVETDLLGGELFDRHLLAE